MSRTTPVFITAFRFTRQFDAVPRRIEFDGVSYDLTDTYTRTTITADDGVDTIFDLSDGTRTFRLREHLLNWWLVGMSSENP